MKLNHMNLTVTDVLAACDFLEKYYDLKKTGGNAGMSFMTDDNGFVLSIMKAGKDTEVDYPGNFHIGFFIGSEAKVDEIHQRLKEDGYKVSTPARHHGYTFYAHAPGGFLVELGA